jgi:hypothetical protein
VALYSDNSLHSLPKKHSQVSLHTGVSKADVHQALNPYTQHYLWLEDTFKLTSEAEVRCAWMPKTSEPPENLLWYQCDASSPEDEWLIAFLLSMVTTAFPVRFCYRVLLRQPLWVSQTWIGMFQEVTVHGWHGTMKTIVKNHYVKPFA